MALPEFLSGSRQIEVITADLPAADYKYVIFDFDGTRSLIREGWRGIVLPMMVDLLAELGTKETEAHLQSVVSDFLDALTGQQTIYQMIRLCEEISSRGGKPQDPLHSKEIYHKRLLAHIEGRIEGLVTGKIPPADLLVPESHRLLQALTDRDLVLYLASGTDHAYVVQEAELLGVSDYFSKAKLIQEILQTPGLLGSNLLGFGDGYVEIENVSQVDGTTIGVASNEATGEGIDTWKRTRLIEAGANFIIPEYREQDLLLAHLFRA